MGTIIKELTKVEDARRHFLNSISPLSATEPIPPIDCTDRVLA